MRIVYSTDAQIPSRATNGMQTMRMCAAFTSAGADVTLVHPHRIGNRPEGFNGDLWTFYGIHNTFRITTLPTPLTLRLSNIPPVARLFRGPPLVAWLIGAARPSRERFIVYSRSFAGAWAGLRAREFWRSRSSLTKIVLELHDEPRTPRAWEILAAADGVVAISSALRERICERWPSLANRTCVEHDGADVSSIRAAVARSAEARAELAFGDQPVVVYAGRVNEEKGAGLLIDAAPGLARIGVQLVLVGKVYDERIREKARALDNVRIEGFVPPNRVPTYLAAADILVLPSTPLLSYAAFTSPLKLFEYMAAGKAIIVSNLPVLQEVVSDGVNGVVFDPNEPQTLVEAVSHLVKNPEVAAMMAENALRSADRFSWERRAQRIIDWVDALPCPANAL